MAHTPLPNIRFPTLGGQQLWLDVYFIAGWRIQKNILTQHHRLLNPKNIRYAWGSHEACLAVFTRLKKSFRLSNPDTHLVLMVHGMAGGKETFFFMKRALGKQGYFADAYNYPSLKGTLEGQAQNLVDFLDTLEGVKEITLIGQSQGGLVIRKALEMNAPWQQRIALKGLILIGTPNQGAAFADFSKRLKALDIIAPKVRNQLTKSYAKTLAPLKVRTGLIAGTANPGRGINPIIEGDDDGIVGVEEVWLEGHNDRLVVRSDHFTLANRRKTIAAALRFLEGKRLSEPET